MPVPFKIDQYPAVFFAVVREILVDLRPLQHRRQKKTNGQCQQHAVGNAHPQDKVKNQRKQKGTQHTDEKIQRDQPVFLTDGQVEHIVKHQHQSYKTAVSRKHVVDRHTAHQMLPEAKGNCKEAAETDIHQHSHPVTGQDILISLFKDHIRHVSGQHGIKGGCCQQGKDEHIQYRAGKQFPIKKAHRIKL